MIALASPYRFTVEQYMSLDIDERTELLEGVIYDVSRRNEPHRYAAGRLARQLARGLATGSIVRSADAVAVSGWLGRDAPKVDVAVLRDTYYPTAPTAADALALVEVSDTSYRLDRDHKIPLYVRAGVPAWIVNIGKRQVESYGTVADLERPEGIVYGPDDTLRIVGVDISVAELFPPEDER